MNDDAPVDPRDPRTLLSVLADGEADAAEAGLGCAAWADADPQWRQRWHAYHLIGDVLRSDDLASPPPHDLAFLQGLRLRLDAEPAVLAPQPLPAAVPRRRSWLLPAAMAAGVMGLAAALVLALGPPGGTPAGPALAQAPTVVPAAPPQVVAAGMSAPPVATAAESVAAGGAVVRDAQLDRYLRAHREYATALPGSLPGGAGRSITTVSLER
jgi:sigma-E factor negative regulatory protein RseA